MGEGTLNNPVGSACVDWTLSIQVGPKEDPTCAADWKC